MSTKWKPGWLMILMMLVASLSLFIAACGGDDDDGGGNNGGDDASATASAGAGDDDDDADATATPAGDDDDDDSGGSIADLADLANNYANFEGSVTYSSTGFTDDDTLGSMRITQKGTSSRIDISSASGESILINTPEASYVCAEGSCIKYPAGDDSANPLGSLLGLFSAETIQSEIDNLNNGVELEAFSDKIAGLDAKCYRYSGDVDEDTPGDESGEFCFSEGGLMLRLVADSADGGGSFEATEASTEVDDSDFEPPYPVVDLSDLGDLGDFEDLLDPNN